jgi:energy-coupling factor transporter ATP-binding protein EcfA2
MLQTKLILLDGVPGSGKSTLAQTLLRHLRRQGIPARWWYEEDAAHPVYVFHDSASLRHVLAELSSGQHPHVVTRALAQWQHFVDAVQAEEEVVLLDGCLFGYLTWSLFPLALPAREIRGFAGLVRYWADYRALTDAAFAALPWDKIALETTSGAWQTHERRVLDVLDLPPADTADGIGAGSPADLRRFVGAYRSIDDAPPATCTVRLGDTGLLLDGMPEVWPDTRLVPTGPSVFDVASLPIEISFGGDTAGGADTMTVGAPEFLGGSIPKAFERERLDSTDPSR